MKFTAFLAAICFGVLVSAQTASTISVSGKKGEEAVEIRNVTYEVAAGLVLRKTEQTRQVMGDKGMEASTLVEAWPLGAGRKGKPAYSLKVEGVDGHAMDNELYIITRGLEDVEWWSLYRLTDGNPLFDTHVRPVRILSTGQYAGLDVPADGDPRLKDERLIGIVNITGAKNVVRRVELRCGDTKRARLLRSYWDVRRSFAFDEAKGVLVLTIRDAQPDAVAEVALDGSVRKHACGNAR
ncbi:MAG: hypothetical protein HYX27_14410 [Acidobacteria bacterium]|nr:hypothetical protein [Acidobacteriota bacterium]